MHDTENRYQIVEDQIFVLLIPGIFNQDTKKRIKNTAKLLDNLNFWHKKYPPESIQNLIYWPLLPV